MLYFLGETKTFFRVQLLGVILTILTACSGSSESGREDDADQLSIYDLDSYTRQVPGDDLSGLWIATGEYSNVIPDNFGDNYTASDIVERRILSIVPKGDSYEIYETQQFVGSLAPDPDELLKALYIPEIYNLGTLSRYPAVFRTEPAEIDLENFSIDVSSNTSLKLTRHREDADDIFRLKKVAAIPVEISTPSTAIGTIGFSIQKRLGSDVIETRLIEADIYSVRSQRRDDRYPDIDAGISIVNSSLFYFDGSEFGLYITGDPIFYSSFSGMPYNISVLLLEQPASGEQAYIRMPGTLSIDAEVIEESLSLYRLYKQFRYVTNHPVLNTLSEELAETYAKALGADPQALQYNFDITVTVNVSF